MYLLCLDFIEFAFYYVILDNSYYCIVVAVKFLFLNIDEVSFFDIIYTDLLTIDIKNDNTIIVFVFS